MGWNSPGSSDVLLTLQKGKPWNNEGAHGLELPAGRMLPKEERGGVCEDSGETILAGEDSPQ